MHTVHSSSTTALLVLTLLVMTIGCESNGVSLESGTESELTTLAIDGAVSKRGSVFGSALSFNGVDGFVVVEDAPSLRLTDAFTIAAWINITTYVEWASIVTKGSNLGDNNYTIHQSGPGGGGVPGFETEFGHLRFTGSTALPQPLPENNTILETERWYFVAAVFDGSRIRYYVDGAPDGEVALSGPLAPQNSPLTIGVDFPGDPEFWHGLIDEVRIWNQPLSVGNVRAAMHGASPRRDALVAYWSFDEGTGTEARDASGHGNHGIVLGGATWVAGAPRP